MKLRTSHLNEVRTPIPDYNRSRISAGIAHFGVRGIPLARTQGDHPIAFLQNRTGFGDLVGELRCAARATLAELVHR
ncbi:hypothetical protein [Mycobacterium asiaticum]|uniref:hypothetical protein n=1 Tax=Mycobacterium asiaticum TaxID=1790 RepID=UPI000561E670|nr:hypothetical protein [Mycobacterium asiaticum]ORA13175.1 hypothetical protein BST16_15010 [Mycobacterium asiaticum DSM 44297]